MVGSWVMSQFCSLHPASLPLVPSHQIKLSIAMFHFHTFTFPAPSFASRAKLLCSSGPDQAFDCHLGTIWSSQVWNTSILIQLSNCHLPQHWQLVSTSIFQLLSWPHLISIDNIVCHTLIQKLYCHLIQNWQIKFSIAIAAHLILSTTLIQIYPIRLDLKCQWYKNRTQIYYFVICWFPDVRRSREHSAASNRTPPQVLLWNICSLTINHWCFWESHH